MAGETTPDGYGPPVPTMGGGRPLGTNTGSAGDSFDVNPLAGGAVDLTPAQPGGQRMPTARDEHGQAQRLQGPFARSGQYMPPPDKSRAAIYGGPQHATF